MANKISRMEAIRLLLSTQEVTNQVQLRQMLQKEGFDVTQATISRNLQQMKVTKAINEQGYSVYVLPNNTQYRRVRETKSVSEMKQRNGLLSIDFSGNIGVLRTRPGYASSLAYDIDNSSIPAILGTVAGDDTVLIVIEEGTPREQVRKALMQLSAH